MYAAQTLIAIGLFTTTSAFANAARSGKLSRQNGQPVVHHRQIVGPGAGGLPSVVSQRS